MTFYFHLIRVTCDRKCSSLWLIKAEQRICADVVSTASLMKAASLSIGIRYSSSSVQVFYNSKGIPT